ncbi:MBL fold metallo-hydrolase RNA specificity domain-containing protein [Marinobacter sp. AL4B]|uniref:MBL fold metallo-hydrolase RNA specificity domain-containing protein n=1 Tax=Marinobacter sp. AL4B TaxID=2871173 RepID=UPI0039779C8E
MAGSGMCAGGRVELNGERYDIRTKVHQVSGYSAHTGQEDLLRFIEGIPLPPKEIRIVHGDSHAKQEFATILKTRLPNSKVCIPKGTGS